MVNSFTFSRFLTCLSRTISLSRRSLPSFFLTLLEGEYYFIFVFNLFIIEIFLRYAAKRFRKAQCPIVERLVNSLMMHGRNNGKKLLTVRIVKHSFEIIHLLTGENPLQVLVNAIINSGPREDSTRIGRAGTVRRQAVDVSPLRRVNQVNKTKKNLTLMIDSLVSRLSGFSAPELARPPSETSRPSPSAWLMS